MIDTQDIEATLMNHIQNNYSETPVEYPGIPFDESANPEYVQPHVVASDGTPVRNNADFDEGGFYINVYATTTTNAQRVHIIADIVKALFHRANLPLLSGDGMIRLKETNVTEIPVEEVAGRRQLSLMFPFQVIQS